jgi:hypothetical protein
MGNGMYIPRELTKAFIRALKSFPSVLVTGPRQSGKTTFVQHVLEGSAYVTFDDPLNRDFASKDPKGFLDQFDGRTAVLDEIQYVPGLFQYIKMKIDKDRRPGLWVLTGSQQFGLMKDVTETLAGRIALLELAPLSLRETEGREPGLDGILWNGLFPEPALFPEKRDLWVKSYIQTYLERDVRRLENIRDFHSFESFVNLCAAYHSQEFHPAALARDCGVSQPTIKAWGKILEASYIAILLPPFFKNFGKRIIKAPKFYFTDPALVSFLTRQPSPESLLRGNMGGAFFEGLIVSEVWKAFLHSGQRPSIFYWRSQGGLEVDLIIQAKGKLWPVEVKLTSTPTVKQTESLDRFSTLAGKEAGPCGVLVCNVDRKLNMPGNHIALPWHEFPGWLRNEVFS